MPKPGQDDLNFSILFVILHSPFSLQSGSRLSPRATVLLSLTTCQRALISHQPTMTFLAPQKGGDFTFYYFITLLTHKPKIMEQSCCNILDLGWYVARILPPFHKLLAGYKGLFLTCSHLFCWRLQYYAYASSTPLGQQDTSLHDITHWPRLWHTFLFRTPSLFFILFFFLSLLQLSLFPVSRTQTKHPPALTDILLHSWLSSFHPGVLVDFTLLEKLALLNLKLLTSNCLL